MRERVRGREHTGENSQWWRSDCSGDGTAVDRSESEREKERDGGREGERARQRELTMAIGGETVDGGRRR